MPPRYTVEELIADKTYTQRPLIEVEGILCVVTWSFVRRMRVGDRDKPVDQPRSGYVIRCTSNAFLLPFFAEDKAKDIQMPALSLIVNRSAFIQRLTRLLPIQVCRHLFQKFFHWSPNMILLNDPRIQPLLFYSDVVGLYELILEYRLHSIVRGRPVVSAMPEYVMFLENIEQIVCKPWFLQRREVTINVPPAPGKFDDSDWELKPQSKMEV